MACKYHKSAFLADYCTAKGRDEKIPYSHVKAYCGNRCYEKCNTYKEVSSSRWFDDLFKW